MDRREFLKSIAAMMAAIGVTDAEAAFIEGSEPIHTAYHLACGLALMWGEASKNKEVDYPLLCETKPTVLAHSPKQDRIVPVASSMTGFKAAEDCYWFAYGEFPTLP